MKTYFALLGVLAVAATLALPQLAGATQRVVPSQVRAVHDTKVELGRQYRDLINTRLDCHPLTKTLWRCGWLGTASFYTVSGDAKVRFYPYGTDVSLYNAKCYNSARASLDYCHEGR